MSYLGSWAIDNLLTFPANTHRFDTGAATDADAVPDYRVYEDETATPILTGSMALLDSANTVGFYTEQITLSAANGFEKGKSYTIYIVATVNSVTATTSHSFQIEAEVDANIVSDKTGYSLSAAGIQAIWDALTSALTTVNSVGKLLVDNVNTTISSRSSHSAADVWAVATRLLTAGTNIVLAKGTGVTGFNDLSAAQVNSEVDTALADYDAPTSAELVTEINSVQADIAALNNLSAAQVNAEVVDALNVDTYAEPGQEAPAATVSLAKKIGYLYKAFRNRKTQTSTTLNLYADNGTAVDQKATISDDGTTYDHGEIGTGP